jgi:hypothetical protein
VLDAFAGIREAWPGAHLILEPLYRGRSGAVLEQVRRRGLSGCARTQRSLTAPPHRWDVLVEEIPGELPALMPLAVATMAGGTHAHGESGALAAAAIASGKPVVVTRRANFLDFPRSLLAQEGTVIEAAPRELGNLLKELIADGERHPLARRSAGPHDGAAARTFDAIRWKLPESPAIPRVHQAWRVPSLRDTVGCSRAWKIAARPFMTRRIGSWAALRERLGEPRSVLCLGNGPSSEDPRLRHATHDCLMRVNWRWAQRGFLAQPDIVFVGDAATVHKVPPCIFGVWDTSNEYAVLLRHLVTHGLRRMEYFTMERLSPIAAPRAWAARPTNGALMVLAGAALQPERLIIGGMDLFLHRDGRYPGDVRSRNQYCHAHSRETDLAIIRQALEDYRGEVVILSDILRESLARHPELSHHGA